MTWQPIETAPKDGSLVLVYQPEVGVVSVRWDAFFGEWDDRLCLSDDWLRPTHWMPLPPPPEHDGTAPIKNLGTVIF